MFKNTLLCLFILFGTQLGWADDNLSKGDRPSDLDLALIKAGLLDTNYKIINISTTTEKLNKKRNLDPDSNAFKIILSSTGLLQEMNFDVTLLKAQSNKDLEDPISKYVDMFTNILFPIYCYELSQNIFTKVNASTMKVSLSAKDGSFIGQVQKNNSECDWEQYNYIDLSSRRFRPNDEMSPKYLIFPSIPNFQSHELGWKKRTLEIQLLVNESGDVIKVGYPNIYFSDETDKIYQKLKPAFLNAKFYPYIFDGEIRSFLITQPIELQSSGSEPLFHKIIKSILSKE
ncbi:hypothetical protein ACNQO6_10400 [Acinetobacter calcoaceticus]|uniref:hypothetical protein n=1 Tax=Acinetobacter calcoaceticus TaxID=471 RepID=UPI002B2A2719|nr:hypothetical protein SB581_01820 [Acinetobacter baumannii]